MDARALDQFIRDVVDDQPEPPRDFPQRPLLVHCVANAPALLFVTAGVVILAIVARFTFTGELAPGQTSRITGFHAIMGSLGFGLVALPLLVYARFAGVVRNAVRTTARVIAVDDGQAPVHAGAGVGAVTGTWAVDHPLGVYEAPFRTTAADGARMPGAEVAVLVHPRRPVVLRELG